MYILSIKICTLISTIIVFIKRPFFKLKLPLKLKKKNNRILRKRFLGNFYALKMLKLSIQISELCDKGKQK